MTIIILSAGDQDRFPPGFKPKQLLEFGGETLFARQLRQLQKQPEVPIVMTHRTELATIVGSFTPMYPEQRDNILLTLKSSHKEWDGRVAALLGDVHFDDETMEAILEDNRPIAFWLGGSEIYALTFSGRCHNEILGGIDRAQAVQRVGRTRPQVVSTPTNRKMWHLYRAMHSSDLHTHQIWDSDMTTNIEGYAFDVDSHDDYLKILKGYSA